MARKNQQKNKDLCKMEVVTADMVWDKERKRNGKPTLKSKYDFFGRIDKGSSCFITKTNSVGENHKFVEDTSNLPKNLKDKIVDNFNNKNKRVVYIVKKK